VSPRPAKESDRSGFYRFSSTWSPKTVKDGKKCCRLRPRSRISRWKRALARSVGPSLMIRATTRTVLIRLAAAVFLFMLDSMNCAEGSRQGCSTDLLACRRFDRGWLDGNVQLLRSTRIPFACRSLSAKDLRIIVRKSRCRMSEDIYTQNHLGQWKIRRLVFTLVHA